MILSFNSKFYGLVWYFSVVLP